MKDFLIGMGIGFVVGAVMVKSNKQLSKAVEKGKQMVEQKVEDGKDEVPDAGVISTSVIWFGAMAVSGVGAFALSKKKKED